MRSKRAFYSSTSFGSPNRGKWWPGQLFPLFPRISEEVLFFTKMVEKVGLANIFHDLGLQNSLSRGKCWPGQFFPPFSSFIKLSQKFVEKAEKVSLATFWRFESWKMLVRLTFSTIFVIYKTSSEIAGKLAGSRFSRVIDGNG